MSATKTTMSFEPDGDAEEIVRESEGFRRGYAAGVMAAYSAADNYGTETMDEDGEFRIAFADPGGGSALRAAGPQNPRILPCPTCGRPNQPTPADVRRHYQCNRCADVAEGRLPEY